MYIDDKGRGCKRPLPFFVLIDKVIKNGFIIHLNGIQWHQPIGGVLI